MEKLSATDLEYKRVASFSSILLGSCILPGLCVQLVLKNRRQKKVKYFIMQLLFKQLFDQGGTVNTCQSHIHYTLPVYKRNIVIAGKIALYIMNCTMIYPTYC